jgi:SPX domain protein involved in polyphosphate accumulation
MSTNNSGDVAGQQEESGKQNFVRSTKKYWVRVEDVSEVYTVYIHILTHKIALYYDATLHVTTCTRVYSVLIHATLKTDVLPIVCHNSV